MTGRTHDLVAFTALSVVFVYQPLETMSLPTVFVAFTANMLGGLAPDIDQTTASFWNKVRFGSFFSGLISPLLGGHRYLSHSLLGIFIFGFLLKQLLNIMGTFLLVNMDIVWWAFMIGFVSHLIADTFTREGVPWLFPIPIRFGIPPIRSLRFKTGGFIEKAIVFPGLLLFNGFLYFSHYGKILDFFRNYLK